MVSRDHAGIIHRILGPAKLRCVAKFRFLEVEYCSPELDRCRDDVDALVNVRLPYRLCSKNAPVGLAEDEFDVDRLCPREIADVVSGVQVNLFVIGHPCTPQAFLAGSRTCYLQPEQAADCRCLDRARPRSLSIITTRVTKRSTCLAR